MSEVLETERPTEATDVVSAAVLEARLELTQAVRDHEDHFVSVDGPCPLTDNPAITASEAEWKVAVGAQLGGYIALDRECFYKPRTNPDDWHGLHSSDSETARQIVSGLSEAHANVIAEVGSMEQLQRYGSLLTAIWIGSRNVGDTDLIEALALADPTLVMGIKNGMDGEIDLALEQVDRVNDLRGDEGAPAVLIYRGGDNARTPEASHDMHVRAYEATGGQLFYDTAHGVEMAHHPDGEFTKSVEGQELASEALVRLAQEGYAPLGKLSEASAIRPIMDPHMPLGVALEHSRLIHAAKLGWLRP